MNPSRRPALTALVCASLFVIGGCGGTPSSEEGAGGPGSTAQEAPPERVEASPAAEPAAPTERAAPPGAVGLDGVAASTAVPDSGTDAPPPSQQSSAQPTDQHGEQPSSSGSPGLTAGALPGLPSGAAAGFQIPSDWAPAEDAAPANSVCPDGEACPVEALPEFYDADRSGDYDYVSLADFTGPYGEPDGVWDANRVTDGETLAWWLDTDQDTFVDQVALNLSGDPEGVVDYWWVDQSEDGVPEQVLVDWSQFPPQASQQSTLPAPGFGEVYLRPNPEGGTDILFGGVAPLPYGWEVESYARTNSCYEYIWITPENQVCVAY